MSAARVSCVAAALLFAWGCDVGDEAFGDFDDGTGGGGRVDMGAVDSGPIDDMGPGCEAGVGCGPVVPADRAARCALVAALAPGCVDRDGDCYVVSCPLEVPAELAAALADCDEGSPDRHPGARELCNDLDDDCDGATDEDFGAGPAALGAECTACGEGKWECSIADPTAAACSTAGGQSAGPPLDGGELCNGADDDCDGLVDEACALDRPAAARDAPVACGDGAALVVEAGALIRFEPLGDGTFTERLLHAGPVKWPACSLEASAWLEVTAAGSCETPADGPARCVGARLWIAPTDGDPRALTGLGELGPPRVAEGAVYWHAVVGASPRLHRAALSGGAPEPLYGDLALGDPSAPVGGWLAVRRWDGGSPSAMLVAADGGEQVLLRGGPGRPGPATLSGDWVVWAMGADDPTRTPALWAVPRDDPRGGFQPGRGGERPEHPSVDNNVVYYRDVVSATPHLKALNLETGVVEDLVARPRGTADWSQRAGHLAWLDAAGDLRLDLRPETP